MFGFTSMRCTTLLTVGFLLAGCAQQNAVETVSRPVIVAQPVPVHQSVQVFSGEVRAQEEPALGFRVGGKIARRLVDVGAKVRQGDVLAELDPQDLSLQAASAQAQVMASSAELDLAKSEYERYQEMFTRQLVSQSLFDAKAASYEAAKAQANHARAQLAVMKNQREYARLIAPQSGVILSRHAEAGQVVAAGQTVFVLAVDGAREIAISVPETDISRFAIGMPVAVEAWAQEGQRHRGVIRELSPAADPLARTYAARVSVQEESARFELGQSARVYSVSSNDSLLSVPLSAVNADAGAAYVYVIDPNSLQAKRRAVTVVAWGERSASLSEGVSEQEWIVTGGVHLISDNQVLRPVDRNNRPVEMAQVP